MTVPSSSAIACSGDGGSGPRAASTRYCIAFLPRIAGLPKPAASIIPSLFVPATGVPAPAWKYLGFGPPRRRSRLLDGHHVAWRGGHARLDAGGGASPGYGAATGMGR